jgi:hypothetical protein
MIRIILHFVLFLNLTFMLKEVNFGDLNKKIKY